MNPTTFKALSFAIAMLFFVTSILSWISTCNHHPWTRVPNTNFAIGIFGHSYRNKTSLLPPIYFLLIERKLIGTLLVMSAGFEIAAFLMAVFHFVSQGRVRILWLQVSSVLGQISLTFHAFGMGFFVFFVKEKSHQFCYTFYLSIACGLISIISVMASQIATFILGTNLFRLFGDGFIAGRSKRQRRTNSAVDPFSKNISNMEQVIEACEPLIKDFADEKPIRIFQKWNDSDSIEMDSLNSQEHIIRI
ncbi:hypothetical protein ACOME3_000434 [Neoechinorhynchus agilis]